MIKEFQRPLTAEQAVNAYREHNGRAQYIAGGAIINEPPQSENCDCVISLEQLGLNGVATGQDDIVIGSCVSLQNTMEYPNIPSVLAQAAGFLRSRHLRNQYTLGGDIAARKHDSFTAAALVALKALVQTADQGCMTAEEYIFGNCDGLILSVLLPADQTRTCAVFRQTRSERGPLLMNMAVGCDRSGKNPIIVVSGAGIALTRLPKTEALLANNAPQKQLEEAASSEVQPTGHWLGSTDYLKHLCGVAMAHCARQLS